jgi:hypothetical protein
MELTLVGMKHHVKAQTILEISNCCPMEVHFVREPENEVDSNAIRIEAVDGTVGRYEAWLHRTRDRTQS